MKFSDGERVLCYEPDPKKVKVIYDAKVLQASSSTDNKGKRVDEYLVHFQGWNASWDRFVMEDLLLKDNDQNRDLQKQLFEQTEEYTRKPKKKPRLSEKIRESVDSACADPGPSSEREPEPEDPDDVEIQFSRFKPLDPDNSDSDTQTEPASSPKTVPDEDGTVEYEEVVKEENNSGEEVLVPIPVNNTLKKRLEEDYRLVVTEKKLVKLPAQPNAITVLEGFVRNYAISRLSAHEKQVGRGGQYGVNKANNDKENFEHALENIQVCQEVVEGLRILLDFQLGNLLLYPNEWEQYKRSYNLRPHMENIERLVGGGPDIPDQAFAKIRAAATSGSKGHKGGKGKNAQHDKAAKNHAAAANHHHAADDENHLSRRRSNRNSLGGGGGGGGRDKKDGGEDGVQPGGPATSCSMAMSSVGSASSGTATPTSLSLASPAQYPQSTKAHQILRELYSWKMVPESLYFQQPVPSSLVYGGVHLARLLVKLPEILAKMRLPSKRSKNIVKYIECLMDYLAVQQDLFIDSCYS